ncbi:hypothetical protein K2173_028174 [Erythroxylum novogranatense]|uniref:Uncharacterized protein n=1 Tax=Erythroxylum novogranatense TaxID=1862640 RepID=A0AAV8U142_9ROSI|nr:hypothetical protein K2173_028174 [Erythroxylum novogranatense]
MSCCAKTSPIFHSQATTDLMNGSGPHETPTVTNFGGQSCGRDTMETPDRASSQNPSSPSLPASVARLWRPAAQRNVRNQWSKLASCRQQWANSSSSGRSHATSLVNAYLSRMYMPSMELGVLSDMPNIRTKACAKLFKQQELYRGQLLLSYKDMVAIVTHMMNSSRSMRSYVKSTSSSPLIQFSSDSEDHNDDGDGGGIPVYTFWSILKFEQLAEELVGMFVSELILKRLLVLNLSGISCEGSEVDELNWSNELYPGEFDDLRICNLYSNHDCQPVIPRLMQGKSDISALKSKSQQNRENLEVCLATWLTEVNIDALRADEIMATVGEEMHVSLS